MLPLNYHSVAKVAAHKTCSVLMALILCCAVVPTYAQVTTKLVIDNQGHSGLVRDIVIRKGGKEIISASEDKTIRFWDVSTGDLKSTIRPFNGKGIEGRIYAMAIDEVNELLFIGGFFGRKGGEGTQIGAIKVIDLKDNTIVGSIKGHTNVVQQLIYKRGYLYSSSSDKTVKIWSLPSRSQLSKSALGSLRPVKSLSEHTAAVTQLSLAKEAGVLISGGDDGLVKRWRSDDQWKTVTVRTGKLHDSPVTAVTVSKDGSQVFSGDKSGQIIAWNGNLQFLDYFDKFPVGSEINTLTLSSNNTKLIAFSRVGLVYDLKTKSKLMVFDTHTNSVSKVALAPFSKFADVPGEFVFSVGGDDKNLLLWDIESGKVMRNLVGKGKSVFSTGYQMSSTQTIAFGQTNHVDLDKTPLEKSFDIEQLKLLLEAQDLGKYKKYKRSLLGQPIYKESNNRLTFGNGEIITDPERDGIIRAYTFLDNGDLIAVASTYTLKLFKTNGEYVKTLVGHNGEVWSVSPLGDNMLISAGNDQTIKLWNIASGELLASLFVAIDNEWVIWTPQGFYEASAGGEKYIGWLINKDYESLSTFNDVASFRSKFHRREVVVKTIQMRSFEAAAKALNINTIDINKIQPPKTTWLNPENGQIVKEGGLVKVRFKVSSKLPITTIKLFVNGRPFAVNEQLTISGSETEKTVSYDLNLKRKGGNSSVSYRGFDVIEEEEEPEYQQDTYELSVYAASAQTNSLSEVRTVLHQYEKSRKTVAEPGKNDDVVKVIEKVDPGADDGLPKLFMISIGVSKFENPQYNLTYADADAKSMTDIFEAQSGKLFSKVVSKQLLNEQATRNNITKLFQTLSYTKPDDMVVIFIASHGMNVDNKFYIVPHDGKASDPRSTCVDWRDFSELVGNLSSQVLLIIDACHSGQLGTNVGQVSNTNAVRELAGKEYGVVIMSASTGAEYSLEHPSWKHGAFTLSLIEGLEKGFADIRPDGTIYLRELDFYAAERVKELTGNRQHPTTQKPSSISVMAISKTK